MNDNELTPAGDNPLDNLLSIKEAAEKSGVAVGTIRLWLKNGRLKPALTRRGKGYTVYISRNALDKAIKANDPPDGSYVSVSGAAKVDGISQNAVWKWIKSGDLDAVEKGPFKYVKSNKCIELRDRDRARPGRKGGRPRKTERNKPQP